MTKAVVQRQNDSAMGGMSVCNARASTKLPAQNSGGSAAKSQIGLSVMRMRRDFTQALSGQFDGVIGQTLPKSPQMPNPV